MDVSQRSNLEEDHVVEELLSEHLFCIDLEKIKLINENPVDCKIKYNYKLFNYPEFRSGSFLIGCDKNWQEIPGGYHQYIISPETKLSEIKKFVEENPLNIMVYDQDVLLGTARFDLSNLFNDQAEMMDFGPRYRRMKTILSEHNSGVDANVGIIKCNLVLMKEECTRCKSCSEIFKNSVIRKHISRGKCKKDYTDEDITFLINKSHERKKKKQSEREKRNYDPEKRAKRHQATYDKKKEKKSYDPEERSARYKKYMATQSAELARNKALWNDMEETKEALKLKEEYDAEAKQINSESLKEATLYYKKCNEVIRSMNLSLDEDTLRKIENIKLQIQKKYDQIGIEIDAYDDIGKHMKKSMEVSKLYKTLLHTYHWRSGDKFLIKGKWDELVSYIENIFTNIVGHVETFKVIPFVIGKHRQIPTGKICNECKNCTSIIEKE